MSAGDFDQKTLLHHCVRLGWVDRTPGERAAANNGFGEHLSVSGFVVSVRDEWFFLTAGHVFRDILKALQGGQKFEEWYLDDLGANGEREGTAVPFDLRAVKNISWKFQESGTNAGADFAIVPLRQHYRELLASKGIIPLDEHYWDALPSMGCSHFLLVGVPSQLMRGVPGVGSVHRTIVAIPVDPLQKGPDDWLTPWPRFYGKLPDDLAHPDLELMDIDGMSGGPIFGFARDENGDWQYYPVAIQSMWRRKPRLIAANYIRNLLHHIRQEMIAEKSH